MKGTMGTVIRSLAVLSGIWLIFNIIAMPLAWGGYNAQEGVRWGIQLAILLGFVCIFLFDLASAGMILTRACWLGERPSGEPCESGWLLILAVLAVLGLSGAKVMVDEIGRETPLGLGAGGEWVILYLCLGLQLSYILAFIFFGRPKAEGTGS